MSPDRRCQARRRRPGRRRPRRRTLLEAPGRGRRRGSLRVWCVCALSVLTACGGESAPPRELPFPAFEARALFPELAVPEEGTGGADADPGTRPDSAFERALQGAGSAPAGNEPTPAGSTPARRVPLGANLVADLPDSPGTWRWSTRGEATLIVHTAGAGRPDALVYTEPFADDFGERPSADLRRFQFTVNPEGSPGSSLVHALARWVEDARSGEGGATADESALAAALRRTATHGRGLGFTPQEDGGSTGVRWVGRNEHRVTLRFARHEGSWQDQRPLPDRFRSALQSSSPEPGRGGGRAAESLGLGRVPAYLLMGTAQEPDGPFGAHVVILCARAPECSGAEELAGLLASVRTESPDLIRRLRQDFRSDFAELARSAGLEVLAPGDGTDPAAGGGP